MFEDQLSNGLEFRYIVAKLSDISKALTLEEINLLSQILNKIARHRLDNGKPKLEAIVYESDWEDYDKVLAILQELIEKTCAES